MTSRVDCPQPPGEALPSAKIIPLRLDASMAATSRAQAISGAERDRIEAARADIERIITTYLSTRESGATEVPCLGVGFLTAPMTPTTYLFEPSLCVSARGTKRVHLGDTICSYDEQTFLLTSVGLPTIVEVPGATVETPYAALQITLDLEAARDVMAELDAGGFGAEPSSPGIVTGPVTSELIDAVARLVRLLEAPREAPFLHAMIHREILFRVLTGSGGDRLRQMVRLGSNSNQISRAVTWLRSHYAERLRIEDLARSVGMGLSTFHHHFREVTTLSPLQYQKLLRLHEARRRLLADDVDAATAAFAVGYESVTQFNREYSRLFGASPIRDVKRLRQGVATQTSLRA
jgi:AraC-like DNA-binding protein